MATFGINGEWSISLDINGFSLTADPTLVESLVIRSHIHQDLPSAEIHIKDKGGEYISKGVGKDGAEANITLSSIEDSFSGNFMLLGGPEVTSAADGFSLNQKAVLNKPIWMKKVVDKHFPQMSSADALSQVASEAGLTPEVDSTDDKMTWLPNNDTSSMYARFVAARGWNGAETAMLTAVTEGGKFLYKDLQKLIQSGASTTISRAPGGLPYVEWSVSDKSAVYNNIRGYGSTTTAPNPEGNIFEFNEISAGLMSMFTGMGANITAAIGKLGTRVEPAPLDSGNTHPTYRQAIHQNRRVKSLYGVDVKVMLDRASRADLLQMVQFEPMNPVTGEFIPGYTGQYMVTGKMRMMQNNRYWECLSLTGQGTNVS